MDLVLYTHNVIRKSGLKICEDMQKFNFIHKSMICKQCKYAMKLSYRPSRDSVRWICRKRHERAAFKRTLFEGSQLEVHDNLAIVHAWMCKLTSVQTACVHQLHRQTVQMWYHRLRLHCVHQLLLSSEMVGGPGSVIEINESLFGNVDIQRSKRREKMWTVGGVVRDTVPLQVFLSVVKKRDEESLETVIQKFVKTGTTIITDSDEGCSNLNNIGYTHLTVQCSKKSTDSISDVFTDKVEATWKILKCSRQQGAVRRKLIPEHLWSGIWLQKHKPRSAQALTQMFVRSIVDCHRCFGLESND